MIKGIDHLVIVVKDLENAVQDYQQLGFTVVFGGKHPAGTHNALISFTDGSYLELITFYREAADHRWWKALQRGERLVDFCFQTDDLRGDTEKLRRAGVAINDPVPWSRTRPDGYEVKWLLSLATGAHRGVAPFLIQDVTPREERVPREFKHKNGASGISKLTIAIEELSPVREWYRSLLGVNGEELKYPDLDGNGLRFRIGPHLLDFVMPATTQSPLAEWPRLYGPSPYSAVLRSQTTGVTLDAKLTHGANLCFE